MAFKKLKLNIAGLNTDLAHRELMELLEKQGLLNGDYLFRGTDIDEIMLIHGITADRDRNLDFFVEGLDYHHPENAIDCYNAEEMKAITANAYPKSPVGYAQGLENTPVIAVFKAKELEEKREFSDYHYDYKHPDKKEKALECVILLTYDEVSES